MSDVMQSICADLAAEHEALAAVLAECDEVTWGTPTPAEGWTVGDQVSHLAYFDEKAALAHTDPELFAAEFETLLVSGDLLSLEREHLARGRAMAGADLLAWWVDANTRLRAAYAGLDPGTGVPWYGPAMGARSKITARIMETWAHGQDVRDALGIHAIPTGRLRHVCHIGVRARPFAYQANGRAVPGDDVAVVLAAPDGTTWEWGDPGADNRVEGPALDFALLVTQRRHRADTALVATGANADEWLDIAQAFAGPPGAGRRPGQFG